MYGINSLIAAATATASCNPGTAECIMRKAAVPTQSQNLRLA
jgi:hypothetical protein